MTFRRSTLRRGAPAALLALMLSLALLPAASSAARTPTYEAGSRVTFTARTAGARPVGGTVYLRIAAKRRFDRYGQLKQTAIGTFARMNRRGPNLYRYTTPPYTFDDWFMNTPGTYYWHTQFTDCSFRDCRGHGPVHAFKVN